MVYRENALPEGEMRRRHIEDKKAEEEKRYQDDLEAQWSSQGNADAEGVPGWAKERFLERKAAEDADKASAEKIREDLKNLDTPENDNQG